MEDIFAGVKTAAVIVAHPDDETIWAGGTIISHPEIQWTIFTLCRKSDTDRNPKFFKVCRKLNATGIMANLDDGPDQNPLKVTEIENTILGALGKKNPDLIITHSPAGEYTRHIRHEELGKTVFGLVEKGKIKTKNLLMFAYTDENKTALPHVIENADILINLPKNVLQIKKDIIINSYGFAADSFEANAASEVEAFWQIKDRNDFERIT